jgi:hypothetical protein
VVAVERVDRCGEVDNETNKKIRESPQHIELKGEKAIS